MENNYLFMAFAKGTDTSAEPAEFKKYIGVAPVWVLAANPSKEELSKIYGRSFENEPTYLSEQDGVKSARVDFIVKADLGKNESTPLISKVTFFLRNEFRFNGDKTKVQVIDKYGRTAWVTKEQADKKEIPMYANGLANIDSDYRPCYVGEEDLNNFIKAYLGVPNVQSYVDGKWVANPNAKPEDCEARLAKVKEMFSGNFTEVKDIASYQPNNKVKVLFGVKTNTDGKQYQTTYSSMVLKNAVKDYSKLDAEIKLRKNNGAFPNTEYEVCPIREYVVEATEFPSADNSSEANSGSWFK